MHQWLGVSPDAGRGRVTVVPQLPAGQTQASGRDIQVGAGQVDVAARRSGKTYTTTVVREGRIALTVGAALPADARVLWVTVDGRRVRADVVRTSRGREVTVRLGAGEGTTRVVVTRR